MNSNSIGIILLLILAVFLGYTEGIKTQKVKYFEEKADIQREIEQKQEEYREKTKLHVSSQQLLLLEIKSLKDKHAQDIITIKSGLNDRLLQSEKRSGIYREKYTASAEQCSLLAEHSSRLDRSLVEGRELVRELSENLRQCGVIYTHAIQYLDNDRNHLNGR